MVTQFQGRSISIVILISFLRPLKNNEIEASEGQPLVIDEHTAKLLGPPILATDYLILGSSFDVANHQLMDEMNVGWVLNVAEECGNLYKSPDVNYCKIALSDIMEPGTHQHHLFEESFKFIGIKLNNIYYYI